LSSSWLCLHQPLVRTSSGWLLGGCVYPSGRQLLITRLAHCLSSQAPATTRTWPSFWLCLHWLLVRTGSLSCLIPHHILFLVAWLSISLLAATMCHYAGAPLSLVCLVPGCGQASSSFWLCLHQLLVRTLVTHHHGGTLSSLTSLVPGPNLFGLASLHTARGSSAWHQVVARPCRLFGWVYTSCWSGHAVAPAWFLITSSQ
jgi:hypothetical protein